MEKNNEVLNAIVREEYERKSDFTMLFKEMLLMKDRLEDVNNVCSTLQISKPHRSSNKGDCS